MKRFKVEGWVQGTVIVYQEVDAENEQEAIGIIRSHYEKNIDMDINNEELYAEEDLIK